SPWFCESSCTGLLAKYATPVPRVFLSCRQSRYILRRSAKLVQFDGQNLLRTDHFQSLHLHALAASPDHLKRSGTHWFLQNRGKSPIRQPPDLSLQHAGCWPTYELLLWLRNYMGDIVSRANLQHWK